MQAVRQKIYNLTENMDNSQLAEIANFILFIKMRDEKAIQAGFEVLSISSTDFWDNDIDDEVWNDV